MRQSEKSNNRTSLNNVLNAENAVNFVNDVQDGQTTTSDILIAQTGNSAVELSRNVVSKETGVKIDKIPADKNAGIKLAKKHLGIDPKDNKLTRRLKKEAKKIFLNTCRASVDPELSGHIDTVTFLARKTDR